MLDTDSEQEFDDLAALAASICGTPMAVISLVDSDRQWFKARYGVDTTQTPRDESFCQHTILGDEVLEVQNATDDERFTTLPLVVGDFHLRFYAGAPIVAPEGEHIGALCALDTEPHELSEQQKRALEILAGQVVSRLELRHRAALLERSNARLSEFAHVAAHDLRAPLRAIASLASFLDEDLSEAKEAEIRETLGLLRSRASRMESLIDGLLDYARTPSSAGDRETDPAASARTAVADIEIPETFELRLPASAPAIEFDPRRFEQIVQNLVGNAVKYSDKRNGVIELGFEENGARVTFWVRDNGPGIERKFHDRVFEAFEKLEPRDEIEGSGVGLAIVKGLVEDEGGEVWVESVPGDGATFYFTAVRR